MESVLSAWHGDIGGGGVTAAKQQLSTTFVCDNSHINDVVMDVMMLHQIRSPFSK